MELVSAQHSLPYFSCVFCFLKLTLHVLSLSTSSRHDLTRTSLPLYNLQSIPIHTNIASNEVRSKSDSGLQRTKEESIKRSETSRHNDVLSGEGNICRCNDLSDSIVSDKVRSPEGLHCVNLQKNGSQTTSRYKRRCILDSDDSISTEDETKQRETRIPAGKMVQTKKANSFFFDSDDSTTSSDEKY